MTTGKLLSGWQSISYAQRPVLKQGDLLGVELHIIKNYLGGSFSEYEFSPSTAVTLAIGKIDTAPSGGTFKLTYGGDATSALPANATETQVQTALNALASITAEGGVTVTRIANSYRIVWNNPSVTTNVLSYSFNELYPTSTINASMARVGSLTQKQIYQVHIKQAPVANITSFVNQDEPVVTVSQIHAPAFVGDTKVWRVSISPQPKSGSFLIGFNAGTTSYNSNAIDVNASGDTVLSVLNTAFNGSWSVVKSGINQWDIATTDSTIFNLSATDSGINPFNSKYGVLDLDTAEVEDLLAGEAEVDAVMEVQLETNGVKFTVIQQSVTILNDLIDDASYSLVQWGDYIPADSVVRYDTAQSLTNAQKQQAKDNIGVSEVDTTALTNKDIELEGRIGDLEGDALTQNQRDAITGSLLPSSTNVLITRSALEAELAQKANLIHTHAIADVTDLSNQLNQKASVVHTHGIGDINGLATALQGKANQSSLEGLTSIFASINHTHTAFPILSVDTLTSMVEIDANQVNAETVTSTEMNTDGLRITGASSSPVFNSFSVVQKIGTALDPITYPKPVGVTYPYEIPIQINGVVYLIPARESNF